MNQRNQNRFTLYKVIGNFCIWLMSKRNSPEFTLGIFLLKWECEFVGLGKDIVFRFIIEYSSRFKGFWPLGIVGLFLYDDF
jgi:hypothetical protein